MRHAFADLYKSCGFLPSHLLPGERMELEREIANERYEQQQKEQEAFNKQMERDARKERARLNAQFSMLNQLQNNSLPSCLFKKKDDSYLGIPTVNPSLVIDTTDIFGNKKQKKSWEI